MTEKELRKLNRYELLEMLLAQGKKLERLERELAEANERLAQRQDSASPTAQGNRPGPSRRAPPGDPRSVEPHPERPGPRAGVR